jgi:hypothetical protein
MLNLSIRNLIVPLIFAGGVLISSCGDDNPPTSHNDSNRTYLSLSRTNWHFAARPLQVPSEAVRSKLLWHNLPEGDGAGHQDLRMIFRPSIAAGYPDAAGSPRTPGPSYAAIYAYVGKTLDENSLYLELRARGNLLFFFVDYGSFNWMSTGMA